MTTATRSPYPDPLQTDLPKKTAGSRIAAAEKLRKRQNLPDYDQASDSEDEAPLRSTKSKQESWGSEEDTAVDENDDSASGSSLLSR